jgi:hypothetical protein
MINIPVLGRTARAWHRSPARSSTRAFASISLAVMVISRSNSSMSQSGVLSRRGGTLAMGGRRELAANARLVARRACAAKADPTAHPDDPRQNRETTCARFRPDPRPAAARASAGGRSLVRCDSGYTRDLCKSLTYCALRQYSDLSA